MKQLYLGTSITNWIIAFAIISISLIAGKFLYWLIQKTIKKKVEEKKDFFFIFIDMVEEPLSLAIAIFGFWYAKDFIYINKKIAHFIDSALYFIILFDIAWFLSRFFDAIVEKYIKPKVLKTETDIDDILLPVFRKLIIVAIWATVIILGLDNAGYDITTMLAGFGIGGLVFALAARDAVSNLFGGFIIFTDKPFSLNDRIIIDGYEGYVKEIGLRSLKLETLEHRIVTIPNSFVTDRSVLNVSREDSRRIKFTLGLTYDTTPEMIQKAKEILLDILNNNEAVKNPVTYLDSFGDFSLNIVVIYWIKKEYPINSAIDQINLEILKRFNENKLEFAFPTQSIIIENKSND